MAVNVSIRNINLYLNIYPCAKKELVMVTKSSNSVVCTGDVGRNLQVSSLFYQGKRQLGSSCGCH